MNGQDTRTDDVPQTFLVAGPEQTQAPVMPVHVHSGAAALDAKTAELAYLAVLAALRVEGGVRCHAEAARRAGASRDEVIGAVLLGLPAEGRRFNQVLAAASGAYDLDQGD
jgi:alkylhydroperoxidase/carboxymuconolactone decarboxylase family protein YurZ